MGRVLRSARTQKAAMSAFVLKAFTRLANRMGQSVPPRVRAWHSYKEENSLKKSSLLYLIKAKP